jgi:hypothetical protein
MPNTPKLSGFNYDVDLLYAAVANSYIETVGTAQSQNPVIFDFFAKNLTKHNH